MDRVPSTTDDIITLRAIIDSSHEPVYITGSRSTLAVKSAFFSRLFSWSVEWSGQILTYELTVAYLSVTIVKWVIDYIHEPQLAKEIGPDNVLEILHASNYFAVPSLAEASQTFLLTAVQAEDYYMVYQFAVENGFPRLVEEMKRSMLQYGQTLFELDGHSTMDYTTLRFLIDSDELKVAGEDQVWDAVQRWYQHDSSNRYQEYLLLTTLIRYPLLTAKKFELVYKHVMAAHPTGDLHRLLSSSRQVLQDPYREFELTHDRFHLRNSDLESGIVFAAYWSSSEKDPYAHDRSMIILANPETGSFCQMQDLPPQTNGLEMCPVRFLNSATNGLLAVGECYHTYQRSVPPAAPERNPRFEHYLYRYDCRLDQWIQVLRLYGGWQHGVRVLSLCVGKDSVFVVCPREDVSVTSDPDFDPSDHGEFTLRAYWLDNGQLRLKVQIPVPLDKYPLDPILLDDCLYFVAVRSFIWNGDESKPCQTHVFHIATNTFQRLRDSNGGPSWTETASSSAGKLYLMYLPRDRTFVLQDQDHQILSINYEAHLEVYDPAIDQWTLLYTGLCVHSMSPLAHLFRFHQNLALYTHRNRLDKEPHSDGRRNLSLSVYNAAQNSLVECEQLLKFTDLVPFMTDYSATCATHKMRKAGLVHQFEWSPYDRFSWSRRGPQFFGEISQDSGKVCFGVDDTLKALDMGAVETLICYENLDIMRYVLRNPGTGEEKTIYLRGSQGQDKSHFQDKESGTELEVEESVSLLEWLANKYKTFGASLEIVTDKSPEGSQFVRGFGGIGGILRYKVDMQQLDTALLDEYAADLDYNLDDY